MSNPDNGPLPVLKESYSIKSNTIPQSTPVSDLAASKDAAPADSPKAPATVKETAKPLLDGEVSEESEGEESPEDEKPVAGATGAEKEESEEPKEPKNPKIAKRLAHIVEREAKLQARETANKEENKKLDLIRNELAEVKKNPARIVNLLEKFGITMQDVTNSLINDAPTEEYSAKKVKEEFELYKKNQEELQLRKQGEIERQTIDNFKNSLNGYLKQNAETYELIAYHGAEETVYDVIAEHAKKTGNIMSHKEAADRTEKYFEDQAKELLSKKKLAPRSSANEIQAKETGVRAKSPKALTNSKAGSNGAPASKPKKSRDESLKELVNGLKWIK